MVHAERLVMVNHEPLKHEVIRGLTFAANISCIVVPGTHSLPAILGHHKPVG